METILYFQVPTHTSTPDKLTGVQRFAERANWHVQKIDGVPTRKSLGELIDFWHPIGAILDCGGGFKEIPTDLFAALPTVYLDRNPRTLPKSCPCISHDSVATGRLAAKELLFTEYENYAFVPSKKPYFWSEDRERGFREALRINQRSCSVFLQTEADVSGIAYQKRIRHWLEELPKPCGLFAANDRIAEEVLTAAAYLGIDVPRELAVVGVDNFAPICEHTSPPLTSIQPDFLRAGELAAETLMDIVSHGGRDAIRTTFGPAFVMRRTSSRTFRQYDAEVLKSLELIAREACHGLTARDVLATFSCSRRMAEMRFRGIVGHSVLDEIQAVRIAKAKEFLADSRRDLSAIADFCGFRNPNSLRKLFRQTTGLTLSAWRERHLHSPHAPRG